QDINRLGRVPRSLTQGTPDGFRASPGVAEFPRSKSSAGGRPCLHTSIIPCSEAIAAVLAGASVTFIPPPPRAGALNSFFRAFVGLRLGNGTSRKRLGQPGAFPHHHRATPSRKRSRSSSARRRAFSSPVRSQRARAASSWSATAFSSELESGP